MKRSIFLIITAVISALFGAMMFFLPDTMIEGYGSPPDLFSSFMMREIGVLILCSAVLNFLVRNNGESKSLKAILIFNASYHVAMIPIVLLGVSQDVFMFDKSLGGLVAHIFIGIGSLIYLMKIKTSAS